MDATVRNPVRTSPVHGRNSADRGARDADTDELGLALQRRRAPAYDDSEEMVMWKNHLIGAGLSLCLAACASIPSSSGAATSGAAAASNVAPVGCVSDTATRIPMSLDECAAFGRAWTGQDIKTTGATNAAQALRLLDPSITVTGH
jgi:hypothetical protein